VNQADGAGARSDQDQRNRRGPGEVRNCANCSIEAALWGHYASRFGGTLNHP